MLVFADRVSGDVSRLEAAPKVRDTFSVSRPPPIGRGRQLLLFLFKIARQNLARASSDSSRGY